MPISRHPDGRVERGEVVHTNPYFRVVTFRVELPSGEVLEPYYVAEYLRESVAVVPVRGGTEALLLRAWRPVTGGVEWEVPAGRIEVGESPKEAAKREVLEETGWEIDDVQDLGWIHPSNATSTERIHLFVAPDPRPIRPPTDGWEIGEIHWLSALEIKALIRSQQITDGVSLTGLLLTFQLGFLGEAT